jgi:hypothetical protein
LLQALDHVCFVLVFHWFVHFLLTYEMWMTTVIMLLGRLLGKVRGLRREVISVKREVVSHHTVILLANSTFVGMF